MSDWLLAAEADKIQDLLFRSSHLREVIGGSQLLTNFCHDLKRASPWRDATFIVSDGGSFRIKCPSSLRAKEIGAELAEKYRKEVGGTISIAEPVPINGDFAKAQKKAHTNLRAVKQHAPGRVNVDHIPYTALCVSCGIGLAQTHKPFYQGDILGKYICPSCQRKADVRQQAQEQDRFLAPFLKAVKVDAKSAQPSEEAETLAKFDPRSYVAYMVADGNSMGEVFNRCTDEDKLEKLSDGLLAKVRQSLAEATSNLMVQTGENPFLVPVMPLILGGDDIFVLLPAKWSLDFAVHFAKAYEANIKTLVEVEAELGPYQPSLSIAVVVCKAKYPFYLAHQYGEELLEQVKTFSKRWAYEKGKDVEVPSAMTFDIILGSRLAGQVEMDSRYRPTLKPYWVDDGLDTALNINKLLDYRQILEGLPRKRLIQLRKHFEGMVSIKTNDDRDSWIKELKNILKRALTVGGQGDIAASNAEKAVEELGGSELFNVYRMHEDKQWFGHALPDLIEAWDFAHKL